MAGKPTWPEVLTKPVTEGAEAVEVGAVEVDVGVIDEEADTEVDEAVPGRH